MRVASGLLTPAATATATTVPVEPRPSPSKASTCSSPRAGSVAPSPQGPGPVSQFKAEPATQQAQQQQSQQSQPTQARTQNSSQPRPDVKSKILRPVSAARCGRCGICSAGHAAGLCLPGAAQVLLHPHMQAAMGLRQTQHGSETQPPAPMLLNCSVSKGAGASCLLQQLSACSCWSAARQRLAATC